VAVRHALGAPLRPQVVTNIYNNPVIVIYYTLSLRAFFIPSSIISIELLNIVIDNYYKRQKNSTIKKTSKTEKQQWMLNIRNSKRGLLPIGMGVGYRDNLFIINVKSSFVKAS
jgi:hypothetical protein